MKNVHNDWNQADDLKWSISMKVSTHNDIKPITAAVLVLDAIKYWCWCTLLDKWITNKLSPKKIKINK